MSEFHKILSDWYKHNKRDLPWRSNHNPYYVWISEIILQQTRVDQGTEYFLRFIERFPNIESLATASENEVLKMWQGLGYYSRARNLHFASRQIMIDFGGIFPNTFSEILKLKGVGDYTAAAIASIAFGLPHAAVDGNVYRVLSRIFGIATPTDSSQGKSNLVSWPCNSSTNNIRETTMKPLWNLVPCNAFPEIRTALTVRFNRNA